MMKSPGNYLFPAIHPLPETFTQQFLQVMQELLEVEAELFPEEGAVDPARAMEELQDLRHAVETLQRKIEVTWSIDGETYRRLVMIKNRKRGYYNGESNTD